MVPTTSNWNTRPLVLGSCQLSWHSQQKPKNFIQLRFIASSQQHLKIAMHALHVPRSPKSLRCVRGSDIVSPELQHCIDNSSPAEAKNLPLPIERMHSSHRDRNPIEMFSPVTRYRFSWLLMQHNTHSLLVKGVDSQSWLRKWLTLYIKWKCALSSV